MTLDERLTKMSSQDWDDKELKKYTTTILESKVLIRRSADLIDSMKDEHLFLAKLISAYTAMYMAGYDAGYSEAMNLLNLEK